MLIWILVDRDKVKQFVINKYGIEQFALLGSYNTFKIKAAIKRFDPRSGYKYGL